MRTKPSPDPRSSGPAGNRLPFAGAGGGVEPLDSDVSRRAQSIANAQHLRRRLLARTAAAFLLLAGARFATSAERSFTPELERRWYEAAAALKRLAESWGDQPYGAVLVADAAVIGEGSSRVVKLGDPSAHAEREAIRDAQRRLGRSNLAGSVLYSTSRPCRQCEIAAAEAQVERMIYGAELNDAGRPRR
jgi:tRNA(Arg) A34 adenosine deaminase TadA